MKQRIRIISDVPLLVLAIVCTAVMAFATGIAIGIMPYAANPSYVISIQITFAVLFIAFFVAAVASVSRSICVITLLKNGISLKIPFRKKQLLRYEVYPYIFYGCYFHGNAIGIGQWVPYIVFAQNRVFSDLLTHINNLKNTPSVFKIRYTQKSYRSLCAVLPAKHRAMLDAAIRKSGIS